eukprot:TRINITY_DN2882_c0_g1_i1.p1 TRINITY_DN2882_c0_g1~~TRINITY_DN2882_c0_g1_i1.p1  ORF type:complete len:569 (-),score=144.83 TRINITY_DN2882_c0_g1_i1:16-1722(-)
MGYELDLEDIQNKIFNGSDDSFLMEDYSKKIDGKRYMKENEKINDQNNNNEEMRINEKNNNINNNNININNNNNIKSNKNLHNVNNNSFYNKNNFSEQSIKNISVMKNLHTKKVNFDKDEYNENLKEKILSDWDTDWSIAPKLGDLEWVDLDKEIHDEFSFWIKSNEFVVQNGYAVGPLQDFKNFSLEDPEVYRHFYCEYFYGQEHEIFIGEANGEKQVIIIRYGDEKEGIGSFVLVLTKTGAARFSVPYSDPQKMEWFLKKMPRLNNVSFFRVDLGLNQSLVPNIKEFEIKSNCRSFKFGVLYCMPDQNVEEDIYSNQETSPQFKEFLEILGEEVELKGFKGFRGGLDIKEDLTGDKTVYNKLLFTYYGEFLQEGQDIEEKEKDSNITIEIVYHIAPYLPYSPYDSQQSQKKRFIGNDLVLVVFRDAKSGDTLKPLDPSLFTSQFNHVFILVQPHTFKGENITHYKVSIASKQGVKPWRPYLPKDGIIKKEDLHMWINMKLINAERAAMYAKEFSSRMSRTVAVMINQFIQGIPYKTALKKIERGRSNKTIDLKRSSDRDIKLKKQK